MLFYKRFSISIFLLSVLVSAHADPVQILHVFRNAPDDGASPRGSLTFFQNNLYGRTSEGGKNQEGIIFKIQTNGENYQILHDFEGKPQDGNNPRHSSMTVFNNLLYGTTQFGGEKNKGVLFIFDPMTQITKTLFSFNKKTGFQPHSCFATQNNLLYGSAAKGGENNDGVIYVFNPQTQEQNILHSFTGEDGENPHGQPLLMNDQLYGMTRSGGRENAGVIYQMNLQENHYKVLHDFGSIKNDGKQTYHGNLIAIDQMLYGMTTEGGRYDKGIVFQIQTDGSHYRILHDFSGDQKDGALPYGSLTLMNSKLYGLTKEGCTYHQGCLFEMNLDGSDFKILHAFSLKAPEGGYPIDNVIAVNNQLYGMTSKGGKYNVGAVFLVKPPHQYPHA